MSNEFKKYAKELSKKVANIDVCENHKINKRLLSKNKDILNNLNDLENSFIADWSSLTEYEDWLVKNIGNKKR